MFLFASCGPRAEWEPGACHSRRSAFLGRGEPLEELDDELDDESDESLLVLSLAVLLSSESSLPICH